VNPIEAMQQQTAAGRSGKTGTVWHFFYLTMFEMQLVNEWKFRKLGPNERHEYEQTRMNR
jgi:hypothetical protein